jgi:hypothetical protein
MVRLVVVVLGLLVVLSVAAFIVDVVKARVVPRLPKPTPRARNYDWERRTEQLSRRAKAVPGPQEDRQKIVAFLDSRAGVEAYVEPRTVMHPLSVVLVAEDGEWVRVALRDDAFLRELSRTRGLAIHDAMRTGYPERMRRYRRPDPGPGATGGS